MWFIMFIMKFKEIWSNLRVGYKSTDGGRSGPDFYIWGEEWTLTPSSLLPLKQEWTILLHMRREWSILLYMRREWTILLGNRTHSSKIKGYSLPRSRNRPPTSMLSPPKYPGQNLIKFLFMNGPICNRTVYFVKESAFVLN